MEKIEVFFEVAEILNTELQIAPLLFGSLGLEQRLGVDLNADDVDILIPEYYLNDGWKEICAIMEEMGYRLYDLHEHAFKRDGVSVAFAAIDSLGPFAGVDLNKIPLVNKGEVRYFLLGLKDYLSVYKASSKDSYRADKNNQKDFVKIQLIEEKFMEVFERLHIQPAGAGYVDLICSKSNIGVFVDEMDALGVRIVGFTWWCHVNKNHKPCGMGGPKNKYGEGWYSEIAMEKLQNFESNEKVKAFFIEENMKSASYKECYVPGFWLEEGCK